MNSTLKPVLAGVGTGGQASPAKGNVAGVNHSVGLPQGAQNSHHAANNLAHHAPPPPMAPVSANMAQMAQNMSHHGNLSHVTQNSITPSNTAASPNKSASTSAPLSLVSQDKANTSQPLALTRTPEKKEPDSTGPANGTVDAPKAGSNTSAALKAQNSELHNDKPDIAKTSPSTPKPPEKPISAPSTPQKSEAATPSVQADGPSQPKVATATEPPEKSPAKPNEPKPGPTADVAPTQSDSKPVPESAKDSQCEKAPTPQKQEPPAAESAKTESTPKVEEKKELLKEKLSPPVEEKKEVEVKAVPPAPVEAKAIEPVEKQDKPVEKVEEKKVEKSEVKVPAKAEPKPIAKPTLKLATVTPPMRKRRQTSPKVAEGKTPDKKTELEGTPSSRTKRNRTQVQLYQSPTPDIAMATKLSASAGRATPPKPNDDKLIVFYKNEYLAVRNAEGGFYVCQAMQNVYRTTRKIKIRWLSQDKTADPSGETYKPDFYDVTDMECVLTTLSLSRSGGGAQVLAGAEAARARSILQRALRAERGTTPLALTEEHPDGLDLSLYKDESQLEKKSNKRSSTKSSPATKSETDSETAEGGSPPKRGRSGRGAAVATKRKPTGSTPLAAPASKVGIVQRIYRNTATAVSEKSKKSPNKRSKREAPPPTPPTPTRKGRRATKESKPSPIVPTPSTSTGKATRTPRKPPTKK